MFKWKSSKPFVLILDFHVYFLLLDDQMVEMVIQHLCGLPLLSLPGGRILSQWVECFCLFVVGSSRLSEYLHWKLWCNVILRELLTWGLILIFHIFFITTFFRLSLALMAPAELQTILLLYIPFLWFICFPAAWLSASPINSPFTRGLGYCGREPRRRWLCIQ